MPSESSETAGTRPRNRGCSTIAGKTEERVPVGDAGPNWFAPTCGDAPPVGVPLAKRPPDGTLIPQPREESSLRELISLRGIPYSRKPVPQDPPSNEDEVSEEDAETIAFERSSKGPDEPFASASKPASPTEPPEDSTAQRQASTSEADELKGSFPGIEVLEFVGRGGMSSVYKARQSGLNRIVALKVLPSEMAALPGFGPRFQREAQAMARLNHPNIVGIHDFGINEDGQYYLVMEFVDGAGLDQVIRDGPVPPDDALAMIPQICEALQFAHESGIVHRDIKPGNILLNKSGQIKVADFGLAKMVSEENADMSLTSTGYILGTPDYMAPEQFEGGDKVDHRADLYALGTVFYQLLTGELPRGAYELPSQKIQVDVRLDEVVIKALEREPELRYQNASEVKSDLEAIRDSAHQAGLPRRKRMLIPSLFAIGILLGVVGLGLWIGGSVDRLLWDPRSPLRKKSMRRMLNWKIPIA